MDEYLVVFDKCICFSNLSNDHRLTARRKKRYLKYSFCFLCNFMNISFYGAKENTKITDVSSTATISKPTPMAYCRLAPCTYYSADDYL